MSTHPPALTYGNDLLRGELVYLDTVTDSDIPKIAQFGLSMELMRYLWNIPVFPQSEDDWKAAVGRWRQRQTEQQMYPFAIRALQDATFIGYLFLMQMDWRNRHCLLGISIGHPDYQGQGYGTDANKLALRYAFMELNMHRVGLEVFGYNKRAIRSYEKLGFTLEGTQRQWLLRDGQWFDLHTMGILRDEWENSQ